MDKKLLLAEDDDLLASLLKFRLEKEGYEVAWSSDGRKVKEQLKKQIPDVIVCDIMLPYFSGLELIAYVRKDLKSNVPIIIISAAGNEETVLNAFELGANDFIQKPISLSVLLVRLIKVMKKT